MNIVLKSTYILMIRTNRCMMYQVFDITVQIGDLISIVYRKLRDINTGEIRKRLVVLEPNTIWKL